MADELEKTINREQIKECRWCGKEYDFKKRLEEVKEQDKKCGITKPHHAAEYCENDCWYEADKTGATKHAER